MAWTRVFPPAHSALSVAATAICPAWLGPLSPMKTTSRKPCCLKLRPMYSSTWRKTASGMLMVPRKAHMAGGRIDAALGRVGDDRRDQRVAETPCDIFGVGGNAHIVLAERHVRTVLLGAAGRNDDGGLPSR